MNKTAFIFDMNGILLDYDIRTIKQKVSNATNIPFEEIHKTWVDEKYVQNEKGHLSSEDYYKHYSSKVSLNWTYDQWVKEWTDIVTVNQAGDKLFKILRKKFPVYILSNLGEHHKIAAEGFDPDFWKRANYNFLSYELGLIKPDSNIYLKACKEIDYKPEDCYFFDDKIENVEGAQEAGLQAFHFNETNLESIENALSEYL